jgi:chromosome partitioning protein
VQRSALMVADVALFPCGPSAADAWALTSSIELFNEALAVRDSLLGCIVITRKQGRTSLGKAARSVLEQAGLAVLDAELSYRVAYQEALAAGSGVTAHSPRDLAAREVRALLDELEKFAYAEKTSGCFPTQAAASG